MIDRIITFALTQRLLTACLVVGIALFGAWCVFNISSDSFPDVSNVQVQIITEPEAMATEEVEQLVTIPIENVLNGLPKITKVRSNSSFGLSVVTAIFEDDTDPYFARFLVQQRLTALHLPPEVPTSQLGPLVSSFSNVFQYYLHSDRHNLIELRTIQDWLIAKRLLSVSGVGNVVTYGGFVKQYQVYVSPTKLKGYGLTLHNVAQALADNNTNAGGNFIEQGGEEVIIRGLGRVNTEKDIEDIVLKEVNGTPVKVSQVASVKVGPAFRRGSASMNGHGEVVTGFVLTRKGANSKDVVTRLEHKLEEIKYELPEGVSIIPYYNQVELVDKTGETVKEILFMSGGLVIIILAAILMHIPAALIATVIIPLSMLFSFILMKYTGLSSNLMTLGAVDFGVIVDAGVVVVENVFRHLSEATKAAKGRKIDTLSVVMAASKEVGRPITFAIFIIVAVYLPLFTLEGVEGKMFHPLALTFVYAILGALLVSLTVIPVMCYWFFKGPIVEKHSPALEWVKARYERALETTIAYPKVAVIIAFCALISTMILLPFLGSEFIPTLDEGSILLRTKLPPSVAHTESMKVATAIENIIKKFPEVTVVVSKIGRSGMGSDLEGVDNSDVYIGLKPKNQWRDQNKEHLIAEMAKELDKVPGLIYSFSQPIADMIDDLISGVRADLAIKIFGEDLHEIDRLSSEIEAAVKNIPGVADLQKERILGLPQLNIRLNRDAIARYGMNVKDIQEAVQTALAGKVVTEVVEGSKRFGLLLRFPPENRDTEDDIKNMLIETPTGALIPLKQLADIGIARGTVMVNRETGQRRGAVLANVRGRDLGSFVMDAQKSVAEKVKLPKGYRLVWGGQFENQQRAMARLCLVVPIVLLLIFLLLFSSFHSLKNAGMVMLNVPFSIIGGIIGLWLTHQPLSVPAIIGFIALFGVAVQNGVILVSYIMQLEKKGKTLDEAVRMGALTRFRPVLMTAMVAMMGLLPKLFSNGTGAEIQRPLATVVFGGLISATSLTLLLLPSVYKLINKPAPPKPGDLVVPTTEPFTESRGGETETQSETVELN
jgi:heavy metal efflux system protein